MKLAIVDNKGKAHDVLDDLGNAIVPEDWDFKQESAREYVCGCLARAVADVTYGADEERK